MPVSTDNFNLLRLLPGHLRAVPAWRDLIEVTSEVIERNIENPRRLLGKVRDTTQYRKDDIVNQLEYQSGLVVDAVTGVEVPFTKGTVIPSARILSVEQNSLIGPDAGIDYIIVEFKLSDQRVFHWRFPMNVPQERSILIQNANMLGFDFFNSSITDEDYRRIVEFIGMYWPEGGTQSFVNFISFIKNIKLEITPLWSNQNTINASEHSILEPKKESMVPVWKGGEWYQTSHIELRYNPIQNQHDTGIPILEFFSLTDDIQNLFYTFAPIQLVLDRIVAAIDLYSEFLVGSSGHEIEQYFVKTVWHHSDGISGDLFSADGQELSIDQSRAAYKWPVLDHANKTSAVVNVTVNNYTYSKYALPKMVGTYTFIWDAVVTANIQNRAVYKPPVLDNYNITLSTAQTMAIFNAHTIYKPQDITMDIAVLLTTFVTSYNLLPPARYKSEFIIEGLLSSFIASLNIYSSAKIMGSATFSDWEGGGGAYPSYRINALYSGAHGAVASLLFAKEQLKLDFINTTQIVNVMNIVQVFQAKTESVRRI